MNVCVRCGAKHRFDGASMCPDCQRDLGNFWPWDEERSEMELWEQERGISHV